MMMERIEDADRRVLPILLTVGNASYFRFCVKGLVFVFTFNNSAQAVETVHGLC